MSLSCPRAVSMSKITCHLSTDYLQLLEVPSIIFMVLWFTLFLHIMPIHSCFCLVDKHSLGSCLIDKCPCIQCLVVNGGGQEPKGRSLQNARQKVVWKAKNAIGCWINTCQNMSREARLHRNFFFGQLFRNCTPLHTLTSFQCYYPMCARVQAQ